jgi:DNA-binding transcriptional regulator YhcF (GntR family)
METVLIQINDNKAYRLLEDLEDLNIIKVLQKSGHGIDTEKLSKKYSGKLPSEVAEELQRYVTQSREEWNNSNI